jgi:hypothetical protein
VRRAQILSKADADGPNWTDHRIAEAFGCRTRTIEKLRQRLVEFGFREALDGVKRELPPVEKLLGGEQEARIIATRLGPPPPGYANWTLRLLARKVVELGVCLLNAFRRMAEYFPPRGTLAALSPSSDVTYPRVPD